MTAAPVMTPQRWGRLDDCVICSAPSGQPCVSVTEPHDDLVQPHRGRTARVERAPSGELLLAHAPGGGALHVCIGRTAVCSGAPVDPDDAAALDETRPQARCQRPSCKRIWAAEAWR